MKKPIANSKTLILLTGLLAFAYQNPALAQENIAIWQEFVKILTNGELSELKMRAYHESLTEPLLEFLEQMQEHASWEEC